MLRVVGGRQADFLLWCLLARVLRVNQTKRCGLSGQ